MKWMLVRFWRQATTPDASQIRDTEFFTELPEEEIMTCLSEKIMFVLAKVMEVKTTIEVSEPSERSPSMLQAMQNDPVHPLATAQFAAIEDPDMVRNIEAAIEEDQF